jgi:hypothetical protein
MKTPAHSASQDLYMHLNIMVGGTVALNAAPFSAIAWNVMKTAAHSASQDLH